MSDLSGNSRMKNRERCVERNGHFNPVASHDAPTRRSLPCCADWRAVTPTRLAQFDNRRPHVVGRLPSFPIGSSWKGNVQHGFSSQAGHSVVFGRQAQIG